MVYLRIVALFVYRFIAYIIFIFIASLPFYLSVPEVWDRYRWSNSYGVFREEKSARRVCAGSKSVTDILLILWQEYGS